MKAFLVLIVLAMSMSASAADYRTIESHPVSIKTARVVELVKLVDKDNLKVNIVVEDSGGSTDVSPTESVYLTIFQEGEMFDVDATFEVGTVMDFRGAKRITGGLYDVTFLEYREDGFWLVTRRLDAVKAINELKAVRCPDFDCPAAANFKSTITSTVLSSTPVP